MPGRLPCQARTQPPIIPLGSVSKDVSGLSETCKFPHPKAHLCFQGRVILPLMSRHQSFPCQSLLLPALVQKRLWRNHLRRNYSISRNFSSLWKTNTKEKSDSWSLPGNWVLADVIISRTVSVIHWPRKPQLIISSANRQFHLNIPAIRQQFLIGRINKDPPQVDTRESIHL